MDINEISKKISEKRNFSFAISKMIVEKIILAIINFLKNGDKIELRGLGSFFIKERKFRNTNLIKSKFSFGINFKESTLLKKYLKLENCEVIEK